MDHPDVQMADAILPVLRDYYHQMTGHPMIIEDDFNLKGREADSQWKEVVYNIIHSLEFVYKESNSAFSSDYVDKGFYYLGRYFRCLWV